MNGGWDAMSRGDDEGTVEVTTKCSRELMRCDAILNAVPTPIFFKDSQGRYLGCNRAYEEVMGVSSAELRGKTVFELWPSDEAQVYHSRDLELMQRRERQVYEFHVVDRQGLSRPVIFAKDVFLAEDGSVDGLVGVFVDISERKRVEAELALVHGILNRSPAVAIRLKCGETWRIEFASDNAVVLFERTAEELCEGAIDYRSLVHLGDVERFESELESCCADPGCTRIKHRPYRIACGSENTWVDHVSHIRRNQENQAVSLECLVVDCTERVRNEEERTRLERRIADAKKLESLGILAGGVAHDLNNILMAVLGNAELALANLPQAGRARNHVSEIMVAAHRAAELGQQMLAYAGKGKLVFTTIELNKLAAETASLLRLRVTPGTSLVVGTPKDETWMSGDATQVRQVVLNLVVNALDAMVGRAGEVRIATGLVTCEQRCLDRKGLIRGISPEEGPVPGEFAYIEVADEGCGLSEEDLERVFEPFYSRKAAGKGLGLSVVLGVVRAHRGFIAVSSDDAGTVFRVHFPVAALSVERSSSSPRVTCDVARVLVADDEAAVRSVCRSSLELLGFEVKEATSVDEVAETLKQGVEPFDVVLLDATMGNWLGTQIMSVLQISCVRVILMGGLLGSEQREAYATLPRVTFLQKPFTLGELEAAMAKHQL